MNTAHNLIVETKPLLDKCVRAIKTIPLADQSVDYCSLLRLQEKIDKYLKEIRK